MSGSIERYYILNFYFGFPSAHLCNPYLTIKNYKIDTQYLSREAYAVELNKEEYDLFKLIF